MMQPTVVISLDLELSWGSFDHAYGNDLRRMATWTHDVGVPNLLRHLTANGISASWAIVGGMMRPSLPDVSGFPEVHYPNFPRPWFDYVPKTGDESAHPEWFGASLVDLIRKATPVQEIGFHSFSHPIFGRPEMTRERAIREFEACAAIARESGFPPICFVFPRNSVAYLDELRDAGFTCFRDIDRLPFRSFGPTFTAIAAVLADFMGLCPPIIEPTLRKGMLSIPGSLAVRYAEGWRKYIPDSRRLRRLQKGLAKVCKDGGVFHVWFHPENLYAEWPRLENVIATFLEELGTRVRRQEVRCLTMGQVTNEFRISHNSGAALTSRDGCRPAPGSSCSQGVRMLKRGYGCLGPS